jgi:hypothetical protein
MKRNNIVNLFVTFNSTSNVLISGTLACQPTEILREGPHRTNLARTREHLGVTGAFNSERSVTANTSNPAGPGLP